VAQLLQEADQHAARGEWSRAITLLREARKHSSRSDAATVDHALAVSLAKRAGQRLQRVSQLVERETGGAPSPERVTNVISQLKQQHERTAARRGWVSRIPGIVFLVTLIGGGLWGLGALEQGTASGALGIVAVILVVLFFWFTLSPDAFSSFVTSPFEAWRKANPRGCEVCGRPARFGVKGQPVDVPNEMALCDEHGDALSQHVERQDSSESSLFLSPLTPSNRRPATDAAQCAICHEPATTIHTIGQVTRTTTPLCGRHRQRLEVGLRQVPLSADARELVASARSEVNEARNLDPRVRRSPEVARLRAALAKLERVAESGERRSRNRTAIGIGVIAAYWVSLASFGGFDDGRFEHLVAWHFFVSIPIALVAGVVVGLVGAWLWVLGTRVFNAFWEWCSRRLGSD